MTPACVHEQRPTGEVGASSRPTDRPSRVCAASWHDSQLTCRAPARAPFFFRPDFSISVNFAFRTGHGVPSASAEITRSGTRKKGTATGREASLHFGGLTSQQARCGWPRGKKTEIAASSAVLESAPPPGPFQFAALPGLISIPTEITHFCR